eukprot:GHVS01014986.1.p2 GENE.GHVS01014986.1~~GHVS01014986.1.p2  ORF type:complete len:135 (+),score=7.95 GHVS01014986.1:100-504(+)
MTLDKCVLSALRCADNRPPIAVVDVEPAGDEPADGAIWTALADSLDCMTYTAVSLSALSCQRQPCRAMAHADLHKINLDLHQVNLDLCRRSSNEACRPRRSRRSCSKWGLQEHTVTRKGHWLVEKENGQIKRIV